MARLSSLTQWGSIVSASVQQEAALYWNIPLMTVRCAAKKEGLLALLAAGDGGEGRREDEEARVDGVYDVEVARGVADSVASAVSAAPARHHRGRAFVVELGDRGLGGLAGGGEKLVARLE